MSFLCEQLFPTGTVAQEHTAVIVEIVDLGCFGWNRKGSERELLMTEPRRAKLKTIGLEFGAHHEVRRYVS